MTDGDEIKKDNSVDFDGNGNIIIIGDMKSLFMNQIMLFNFVTIF